MPGEGLEDRAYPSRRAPYAAFAWKATSLTAGPPDGLQTLAFDAAIHDCAPMPTFDEDARSKARSPLIALGPAGFLVLISALSAFPPVTTDIYLPALPELTRDLAGTTAQGQQTLAAFFVGLSIGQLGYGPWSDRIGRRPVILIGVAVYLAASFGCALAHSMPAMIVLRFIQAVGASAAVVASSAMVRDRYDHLESAKVLSMVMLVRGLGPIVAPVLGGLIVTVGGWRAIFWALSVFGVVIGAVVLASLEETRTAAVAERARSESPLKAYLGVLASGRTMAYVMTACLNFGCLFAWVAAAPFLLIGVYRIPPLWFGWVFLINALGFMATSQINRALLRRCRPDSIMTWGAVFAAAAAAVLMADALTGALGPVGVLAPLFLVISSLGFVATNAQAGALAVDPPRAGTVSAVFGACQFMFGAVATAAGAIISREPAIAMATVILVGALGALALPVLVLRRR